MNSCHWFRVSVCIVSAILFTLTWSARLSAEQLPVVASKTPFVSAPILPLSYASSSIAVGDLNGDGKLDLVTADWDAGKVTVSLGLGDGSFAAGVDYAAGDHPTSLILTDIDGDGQLDVVAANASAGTVSVLLGSGNGQLLQPHVHALGFDSSMLAIGDFSGSGRSDLVAVDAASNRIALLLNDGNGGFGQPALYTLVKMPVGVTVADLNHDGHQDLAFANSDGSISILWGGKGSFQPGPVETIAHSPLSAILAGDFNHDGILDLAVTVPGSKQLTILTGKGDGSFATPASYSVGTNPVAITSADVDEDGVADLIVTNQGSNTFSVLGGNKDGSFRTALDFVAGNGPITTSAGDFNNDGHLDLVVLNQDGQSLSLPLGNGDGTFAAARAYSVEMQPRSVAAGDLAGNKRSDLVVTNFCGSDALCAKAGSISILVAGESDSYHLASTYALGVGPVAVALLDVDNDKNLDIVALNRADKTISILLGLGGGSFQQQFTLPLANAPVGFAAGDFNHDGKIDLAVIGDCGSAQCTQPGTLEILYGSGDGGFLAGPSYPVGFAPASLAVADLNGDKNLDLVVANRCGSSSVCTGAGTASVFLGDAKGQFTAAQSLSLDKSPSYIALANLSGTGTPDLLVSRLSDNTLAVLRGNGDGSFGAATTYAVGTTPGAIAVADFNGDGKLDVAVGNLADSTVSVLYGKGDGTLLAGSVTSVGPGPFALATLQSGSGGRAGLVTANAGSAASTPGSEITVLANLSPEVIGTALSSTTIQPTATSANVNDPVTLTAVVTGDPTDGAPTGGNVIFLSAPNAIADCNGTSSNVVSTSTSSGDTTTFVCVTHSLQATSQTVNAQYNGDPVYAVSSSTTAATVNVTALPATLTLVPSTLTTPVNGSVTFTPTLTASATSPIAPNGTVHFLVNGNTTTDCPDQLITKPAVCTTKSLTVGHGTVTATYSGDTNFTYSGTASSTVTVTQVTTPLNVTVSANPTVGSSVTVTVQIPGAVTPTAPTGGVVFKVNGATPTSSGPLGNSSCLGLSLTSGTASCTTIFTAAQPYSIEADYAEPSAPDPNFDPGPGTQNITVGASSAITLTVAPSKDPGYVNEAISYLATLKPPASGPAPGGTVTFTDQNSNALACSPAPVVNNVATCGITYYATATPTITAYYNGDGVNYLKGATNTTSETIDADPTSTTIAATAAAPLNQPVTFTATVSPTYASSSSATLAGTVTFTDTTPTPNIQMCAPASTPLTNGVASCAYAFPSKGPHQIQAVFNPTNPAQFATSTGTSTQSVAGEDATTLKVTLVNGNTGTSTVNQPVAFMAVVTPVNAGKAPMNGTITFTDSASGALLCKTSGAPSSSIPAATAMDANSNITSASATCTAPLLKAGTDTITATFNDSNNNYGSSSGSPAQPQTVNQDTTSIAKVTASAATSTVDQSIAFTASISASQPYASNTAFPSGTISFIDSATSKVVCTGTVAAPDSSGGASASCNYANYPASATAYKITALYNGDTNFQASVQANTTPAALTVSADNVVVALIPPVVNPVATQTINLNVSVTPTNSAGTIAPTGTVTLSSSDATATIASCGPLVQAATGNSATAICPVAFSSTDYLPVTVTATYKPDANFTSGGPISATQAIKNFSLQPSSTAPIIVTPGYTNTTDPFLGTSSTVYLTSVPTNAFTDLLAVSCSVSLVSSPSSSTTATSLPTCSLLNSSGAGSSTLNGDGSNKLSIQISAVGTSSSPVPAGQYLVTLSGTDQAVTTLTQSTSVTVDVLDVAGTLNLPPGSSGTVSAIFDTGIPSSSGALPTTLSKFACTEILTSGALDTNTGITCTVATASVPVTGSFTSVAFAFSAGTPAAAAAARTDSTVRAAALWITPVLLACLAWLGRGRPRRSFVRFLGLLLLITGIGQGLGCGGKFTAPTTTTAGTAPGSYIVQVVATGDNGVQYTAVVPIYVN